jgi:hypothetical protein
MVQSKHGDAEKASDRGKVWLSVLTSSLGWFASVIGSLGVTAGVLKLPSAFLVGVAAVLVTAVFTVILTRRERGSTRVARLKNELRGVYLASLDDSPLNPVPGEQR